MTRFTIIITVTAWALTFAHIGTQAVTKLSHFHYENGLYPHD